MLFQDLVSFCSSPFVASLAALPFFLPRRRPDSGKNPWRVCGPLAALSVGTEMLPFSRNA